MSRKTVAIAIILLISFLAPATAVLAFCAQTPCCAGQEEEAAMKSNRSGGSCCAPVTCYESQESKPVKGAATAPSVSVPTHALSPVGGDQAPAPQVTSYFNESSPPPSTARRLSALSTLLI